MASFNTPAGGWTSFPIDGPSDMGNAFITQMLSSDAGQQALFNRFLTNIKGGVWTADTIASMPAWIKILINGTPTLKNALDATAKTAAAPSDSTPTSSSSGPTLAGPGVDTSSTVTTDISGKPIADNAILPGKTPPLNPTLQDAWNKFLNQNVGKGLTPYPGMLTPATNDNLKNTWGAFQSDVSKAPGASWLLGPGMDNVNKMITYGGTGGPGNYGMANMMNFGTPSQVGQPLSQLAQGNLDGMAQYLAPFLTAGVNGGARPGYAAPLIPIRSTTIGRS